MASNLDAGRRLTYHGKEIEHPALRALAYVVLALGMVWLAVALLLLILLCVISLPLHGVLLLAGREGFWDRGTYELSAKGFRKWGR